MMVLPFYEFTRPNDTTAYTAGDLMANSTTASEVVPLQWDIKSLIGAAALLRIEGAYIRKSSATVTSCNFRLHFYWSPPAITTAGDNGAFASDVTGVSYWLGNVQLDIGTYASGSRELGGAIGIARQVDSVPLYLIPPKPVAASLAPITTLYALIEQRGAYTPTASEVFGIAPIISALRNPIDL